MVSQAELISKSYQFFRFLSQFFRDGMGPFNCNGIHRAIIYILYFNDRTTGVTGLEDVALPILRTPDPRGPVLGHASFT